VGVFVEWLCKVAWGVEVFVACRGVCAGSRGLWRCLWGVCGVWGCRGVYAGSHARRAVAGLQCVASML